MITQSDINNSPIDEGTLTALIEDLRRGNEHLFNKLTAEQREWIVNLIRQTEDGDMAMLEALYAADYDHIPADPHIFFTETDYMRHVGKGIYRAWWPHLLHCCDPTNRIIEPIFTGAIGAGKTFVMMAVLVYKLYRMMCLKSPSEFYKLADKSKIIYGIYSITLKQAHEVGFYVFRDQMLEESPFFRYVYPRFKGPDDSIILPKGIQVITGSSALHAIGRNLYAIAMDELNFLKQGKSTMNKAHELTTAVRRRLASRFKQESGEIPGLVGYISSKLTQSSFLESRIKARKEEPGVYVVDGPLWEFSEKIDYCGKTFRVSLGDDMHEAQILDEVSRLGDGDWNVRPISSTVAHGGVINVPVEHYEEFEEDPYEAIRDIAGIATASFTPFFPRKRMLKDMIDEELPKAFDQETIQLTVEDRRQVAEYFKVDRMCTVYMGKWVPLRHLNAPRYIHVDLSKNEDRTGMCMVHPSSHYITGEVDDDGKVRSQDGINMLTVIKDIEVDFALAFSTNENGANIDYQKIRNFIMFLRDIGFWIRMVTFDSYQAIDSINMLRGLGLNAEVQSMDRTAIPYKNVRQIIAERRVQSPPNELLFAELSGLEYDVVLDKVDHQEDESKDVSDAFGGATYQCLIDKIKPSDVPVERRQRADQAVRENRYDKYLKQIEEYI